MWVQALGGDDLLEKEMATLFSLLAWRIPWTEWPGGLQPMGSQRVGDDLVTKQRHHVTVNGIQLDWSSFGIQTFPTFAFLQTEFMNL